jgi:hypothetical protein
VHPKNIVKTLTPTDPTHLVERLEAYLKGTGYLPFGGVSRVKPNSEQEQGYQDDTLSIGCDHIYPLRRAVHPLPSVTLHFYRVLDINRSLTFLIHQRTLYDAVKPQQPPCHPIWLLACIDA